MKYVYVVVDTNDADYVGKIVKVSEETLEHFKPLIEKIKNFQPYNNGGWRHNHNFPFGECLREDLGEKHPMEMYNLTEEEKKRRQQSTEQMDIFEWEVVLNHE